MFEMYKGHHIWVASWLAIQTYKVEDDWVFWLRQQHCCINTLFKEKLKELQ